MVQLSQSVDPPHAPLFEKASARIRRELIEAHAAAEEVRLNAAIEASNILEKARREAAEIALNAARDAKHAEEAKFSARYLALQAEHERHISNDTKRMVSCAVLLAERLLGRAIESDPTSIAFLTSQALSEARGARCTRVDANPCDIENLKNNLELIGLSAESVDIRENISLSRGSLRIYTNLGILDAELSPQLERLAAALVDAINSPR